MMKISLLDHITAILHQMDIRYDNLFKQIDLRYQQRYDAQTKAVEAAFLANQTAMQAALLSAEKAVATALTSAEKAVNKAETAAERRFESVNEFRAQLADQASTFMPRIEAEQRMNQITVTVNEMKEFVLKSQGSKAGVSTTMAMFFSVGGLLLVGIGIIVTIVIATRG